MSARAALAYTCGMLAPPTTTRRGPAPTKHIDILWAAARLFATKGVAQTSTLFKHFGSKDGLVKAVIDEAVLPHLAPTSLDALRKVIEKHGDDFAAWHMALLEARSDSLAQAPELTRLLLVEMLRDSALLQRFVDQWLPAVWQPLLALFERLQHEGKLAKSSRPDSQVRMFLSLNVGYLLGRHILAPDAAWDDAKERQAIAGLFMHGAAATRAR
jgi:AcrR family transcriptional regulator